MLGRMAIVFCWKSIEYKCWLLELNHLSTIVHTLIHKLRHTQTHSRARMERLVNSGTVQRAWFMIMTSNLMLVLFIPQRLKRTQTWPNGTIVCSLFVWQASPCLQSKNTRGFIAICECMAYEDAYTNHTGCYCCCWLRRCAATFWFCILSSLSRASISISSWMYDMILPLINTQRRYWYIYVTCLPF